VLAAFLIMGHGIGASGAFTSAVSAGVHALAPEHAEDNGMFAAYLKTDGRSPLSDWFVIEILGVLLGGFLSGHLAGRRRMEVIRGPRFSSGGRLILAFVGGVLMGFATKLARGCTSGQALSGGAVLNVGSWLFVLSVFAAAYAFAFFFRRQWR
jgi:hypothetical protein